MGTVGARGVGVPRIPVASSRRNALRRPGIAIRVVRTRVADLGVPVVVALPQPPVDGVVLVAVDVLGVGVAARLGEADRDRRLAVAASRALPGGGAGVGASCRGTGGPGEREGPNKCSFDDA